MICFLSDLTFHWQWALKANIDTEVQLVSKTLEYPLTLDSHFVVMKESYGFCFMFYLSISEDEMLNHSNSDW